MATTVREVMAPRPVAVPPTATLADVAGRMRDSDIGDVIVQDSSGRVTGIVTDRDIVVRAVADDRAPGQTTAAEICSTDLVTVRADDPVERAMQLMRGAAVRRLPVVQNGHIVGVVSLGDLAVAHDPGSALADISAAEPTI